MRPLSFFTVAAVGICIFALGLISPGWLLNLGTISLAQGIVVMGLVPLFRAALIPFGHALYYCLGGYAVGILRIEYQISDAVISILIAAVAAGILSGILGFLMRTYREIFFAMLSLAFSMLFYGVLVKSASLGSTDGFNVKLPTYFGWLLHGRNAQIAIFAVACTFACISVLFIQKFLSSVVGVAMTAIRDNEIRVEYLGRSASQMVHVTYVIGGVLAGIGGAITAFAIGHVDPQMGYWTTSGEFVFITILSGVSSVVAPFAGSALFNGIHTLASEYAPEAWRIILGVSLLVLILFMPGGIASISRATFSRQKGV